MNTKEEYALAEYIETLRRRHVEMYVWLADNDAQDKSLWPGWTEPRYYQTPVDRDVMNRGSVCYGFCCPAARALRGAAAPEEPLCWHCPVEWNGRDKYEQACLDYPESMYKKWRWAKTPRSRRRIALRIAHAWLPAGIK